MPFPTPEDYVFEPGADPTSVFPTDEATLLLSFGRLMTTNSYYGIVIHSETTPPTTGQPTGYPTDWYAWNKRCLWHKPSTNEVFGYETGLGWVAVPVSDGTVDTAQIVDGAVTLAKMAVYGTAFQLIRVNAGATALEAVSPSGLFGVGTLPIDRLAPGTGLLQSNGSTVSYALLTSGQINTALAIGLLNYTAIAVDAPLRVLRTNAAGTAVEYANPVDLLSDNTLPITKLSPGTGNALRPIRVNSAGTAFEYYTPIAAATVTVNKSTPAAVPVAGAAVTFTHALGAVPTQFFARLICVSPNNGYVAGDELDIGQIDNSNASVERQEFVVASSATTVTVRRGTAGNPNILNLSTGAVGVFAPADWNVQITAMLLA